MKLSIGKAFYLSTPGKGARQFSLCASVLGTSTKGSHSDSLKRVLSWPQQMLTASFPPEAPPSLPRVTIACPGQLLVTKQEQYGLLGLLIPG